MPLQRAHFKLFALVYRDLSQPILCNPLSGWPFIHTSHKRLLWDPSGFFTISMRQGDRSLQSQESPSCRHPAAFSATSSAASIVIAMVEFASPRTRATSRPEVPPHNRLYAMRRGVLPSRCLGAGWPSALGGAAPCDREHWDAGRSAPEDGDEGPYRAGLRQRGPGPAAPSHYFPTLRDVLITPCVIWAT